ncbi:transmembrane protein 191C [Sarcophilus harrisii]|uniref:transmembrane protein 191C n=1 Tax=Sarcophilus harrisii TaxID=9305 RepID=UPI001301B940|nr:transmembrane protein 191C [Sarcophilus harrisii]
MAEAEEILLQLQKDNRDGRLRKQELEELMRILETESDSLVLTLRSLRERERSLQRRLNQAAGALRGEAEEVVKSRAAHTLELIADAAEQKLILERNNQLLQEEWEELSSQVRGGPGRRQAGKGVTRPSSCAQKQLELMESRSALQAEGIQKGIMQKEEAWSSFQEQSGVLQELQTKVMEVASVLDTPREGMELKAGQVSPTAKTPGSLMEEVAEANFVSGEGGRLGAGTAEARAALCPPGCWSGAAPRLGLGPPQKFPKGSREGPCPGAFRSNPFPL